MSNLDNVTKLKHINNLAEETARAINELLINGLSGVDGTADVFTGATSLAGGASGLVPAPAAGDEEKFLRGDGTWALPQTVAGGASSDVIVAGSTVLDTTPATVDGGMWYEIRQPYVITKMHYGNKNYTIHKSLLTYDYCVSWLPFASSITADKCGNSWTAYGTPTIKYSKLKLDGNSSYLAMNGGITLGGQDFTIRGKFNMANENPNYSRLFQIFNTFESTADSIVLFHDEQTSTLTLKVFTDAISAVITLGKECDFELDYSHAAGKIRLFLDGELKDTLSKTLARTHFVNVFLGKSNYVQDKYFVGTIDEFMIFDGVALHTENFTPPTADDYDF